MTKIYVKNDFDIFVPSECFMEPLVTGNKNVKSFFASTYVKLRLKFIRGPQ